MNRSDKDTDIYIVAGEASGDLHGANLTKALKALEPEIQISGLGGPRMKEAGCEMSFDLTGLAVMGLKKVLPLIGRFINVIKLFRSELTLLRPKVVVLIDYPGLNFLLAHTAKSIGIPVVYYCCPQLWAWAPWRAKKIKRLANKLLLIFPFEKTFFSGGKAEAYYVGHPLCDELAKLNQEQLKESVRSQFSVEYDELLVGLFPGSRKQEVEALAQFMGETAALLSKKERKVKFVFSVLNKEYVSLLPSNTTYSIFEGPGEPLMAACDVGLVASGTASLELAYFGKPIIVIYALSKLKQKLFRFLTTTPFICSTNLLAGRRLIAEHFVCSEEDATIVADELDRFITNPTEREQCSAELKEIGSSFLQSGASNKAAEIILGDHGITRIT